MSGRRFVIVLACLSFVGLLVFSAVRDIGLKDEIIRLAATNLPDMTMDNIKFERRTENGYTFRFHSNKVRFIDSEKIIEMPEGGTLTWTVSDEKSEKNEKTKTRD